MSDPCQRARPANGTPARQHRRSRVRTSTIALDRVQNVFTACRTHSRLELPALSGYLLLKLAHVLLAVIAIGANLTYALWLRLGEREPQHLPYTIRSIRAIDRRVANPAYALLLVTGAAMALTSGIPLTQAWLALAIAIYLAAAALGYLVFGPVVRGELAALERGGTGDPEYLRSRGRARTLGVVTTAMVLTILALMVVRPG